jgi:hypothetical protein
MNDQVNDHLKSHTESMASFDLCRRRLFDDFRLLNTKFAFDRDIQKEN